MIKAKGNSWDGASDGTNDVYADVAHNTITDCPADGAISDKTALVTLSKAGVGAYTLAAPVATTDDGKVLTLLATSANAHVVTSAVVGFNAKGSSGTLTFGGAIGDTAILVAKGGNWYLKSRVNVTAA